MDVPEDKDLLKRLLEKRKPDGTIDLGNDSKDLRRKWFERLMEIMDRDFSKNSNKVKHVIKAVKHGFNYLLKQRKHIPNTPESIDAEQLLSREIQEKLVLQGDFPGEGQSFKGHVAIDTYDVTVEGRICEGIPKIGTSYIESLYELCK